MATILIGMNANIQAAINANPVGTIFQLAAVTYRGQQFQPKGNDQFLGDPGGGTILSGAIQLSGWTASGSYYVKSGLPAQLEGIIVAGGNPMASHLNDLFVNNVLYTRVASLTQVKAGTWYFNTATRSAYISDNPTGKDVEYSLTQNMTSNGSGATGVVMQNLTIERYAADAQMSPVQSVVGWTFNNVTSTQNHGAGLNIGTGTVVNGGHYNDNGQEGITGLNANGAKILNAEIADNNYAGYSTTWDAGGIKLFTTASPTISGNNVHDNVGQGIWADGDSSNWTVSNNSVVNNTGNGIMYEVSHSATNITGNIVAGNGGAGIYIANSDGVNVSGNTVTVGATNTNGSGGAAGGGGIDIINDARGSGPAGLYQSINNNVHDNVIIHNGDTAKDGIYIYQAISSPANANNVFNSNTYRVANPTGAHWHFGSTDYSWTSLHQNTANEALGTENGALFSTGAPVTSVPPVSVVIGSGPNTLALQVSEDAWNGDAQFRVAVDGKQIGGILTATASHAAGQTQIFNVMGTFASGNHTATVNFLNDAYGGSATTDRNLYVIGTTIDGNVVPAGVITENNSGPVSFTFLAPNAAPMITVGSGPNTLALQISEDAWTGDAQFTVAVDGKQIGGTLTAAALHSEGQTQLFNIKGSFAAGSHVATVNFLNNAYGGSGTTDRNLYVTGAAIDGTKVAAGVLTEMISGPQSFSFAA